MPPARGRERACRRAKRSAGRLGVAIGQTAERGSDLGKRQKRPQQRRCCALRIIVAFGGGGGGGGARARRAPQSALVRSLRGIFVQLEAHDGDTARAILRDHATRLQASVEATRPAQRLLQLPAELISIVLRKLLEDRSTGALYALTSTCKFLADRGENLQRPAGVGQRLLVAECTRLFPLIAREAASRDERYLLEFTNILLGFDGHLRVYLHISIQAQTKLHYLLMQSYPEAFLLILVHLHPPRLDVPVTKAAKSTIDIAFVG